MDSLYAVDFCVRWNYRLSVKTTFHTYCKLQTWYKMRKITKTVAL